MLTISTLEINNMLRSDRHKNPVWREPTKHLILFNENVLFTDQSSQSLSLWVRYTFCKVIFFVYCQYFSAIWMCVCVLLFYLLNLHALNTYNINHLCHPCFTYHFIWRFSSHLYVFDFLLRVTSQPNKQPTNLWISQLTSSGTGPSTN